MEIDIFTLCDFAQEVRGKLTIIGTFDIINSTTVPAVCPTCHIIGRIQFNKKETGKHSFKITFLDNEGNDLVSPMSTELETSIIPDTESSTATLILGIGQLTLPSFGKYSINLFVDDKLSKSLTLRVKEIVEKA